MPENIALENKYRRVFNRLTHNDLTKGLDAGDLTLASLTDGPDQILFLDFYTREGLRTALEAYGFYRMLSRVGIGSTDLSIDRQLDGRYLLKLFELSDPTYALVDLSLERTLFALPESGEEIPVLKIGWLELRHPRRSFSIERLPLPGQAAPGLGLGWPVFGLLRRICKRLGLVAIVARPAYFHNAFLYLTAFNCVDAREQGVLLAMVRDLPVRCHASIAIASWALFLKHTFETSSSGEQKMIMWSDPLMIAPLQGSVLSPFFESTTYLQQVNERLCDLDYRVDMKSLAVDLERYGVYPLKQNILASTIEKFGWI